ncbi:conserved hypothetical protein [Beggiatoa sp. PS]|nr:conserved hypothetical protein [Beggiatoa sp. PS]
MVIQDNVISNNKRGIYFRYIDNSQIIGNTIKNSNQEGIRFYNSSNNQIGGINSGEGNTISGNTKDGIYIQYGEGNTILGNLIYDNLSSNKHLGIDLYSNGYTANDNQDSDSGTNNLQNSPILTSLTNSGNTLNGIFNSIPNTTFRIEFFANTDGKVDKRNSEGEEYLGSQDITTDGNGDASFNFNISPISGKNVYTATATKLIGGSGSNPVETSEFSKIPMTYLYDFSAATFSDSEGNTNPTTSSVVSVIRSGDTSIASQVKVELTASTALATDDFVAGPITINFVANETDKTVDIDLVGDTVIEPNETLELSFLIDNDPLASAPAEAGGVIGTTNPTATLTIINDDGPPAYDFEAAVYTVEEANSNNTTNVVTVTRSGDTNKTSSVDVVLTDGTATAGNDFTAGPITLNFAIGEISKTVPIEIIGDSSDDDNEALTLSFANFSDGGIDGTAQPTTSLVIIDDDNVNTVYSFNIDTLEVIEGDSDYTINTVSVIRSGNISNASSVDILFGKTGDTAKEDKDFSGGAVGLDFEANSVILPVPIEILGDTNDEGDEFLTLLFDSESITTGVEDTYTPTQMTLTLINDDADPTYNFGVANYRVEEGDSTNTTSVVTVTRFGNTSGTSSVNVILTDGTATASSDFTYGLPIPLSFIADEISKAVPIEILGETDGEANETLTLSFLPNSDAGTTQPTATLTIINDDAPLALTNLVATAISQTEIDLSWIDNSADETGFKITRDGTPIETTVADVESYSDTGLTCNTTYVYQVTAINGKGNPIAMTASATTDACTTTVPDAPTNLTATAVSQTQINLSWVDNSDDETGFKITRDGTPIKTTISNIISYSDTGLTCNTTYVYQVTAIGNSTTIEDSATTSACTTTSAPDAPTSLTATAVSQTQINLAWVDNSDDETGFKIKRDGTLIKTTISNIESYNDTGLTCNTTYTYQVTAYNDNDNSESTTIEATATTHACDEEDNSSSGGGTTPLPSKLNLTIKFGGKGSGSVESDPSGIDCDSNDENCSYLFSTATSVTLTPTPTNGSKFSSWGGHTDCGDGQVRMTSSISCTVFFQLLPSTLAVTYEGNGTVSSSPSGINCGDSCTDTFDGGTEVTLTATPDDGWIFDQWTGDCNSNGRVTIDSGKACHAIFVEEGTQETEVSLTPPYLKVTKIGEGTITSEPIAINCGGDCTQEYAAPGTEVTLTATPDEGWAFDKWEGDCDDNGQITITDQGDQCEAIFVQTTVPFVLNVAITGQGSVTSDPTGIDCGDTCNYDYQNGMEIVLTATPDYAWEFEGWRGHCDETGKVVLDGQFNFKQCRAVFIESTEEAGLDSKALALEITGNGTVTSQPSGIDCGKDCTEDYTNDTEVTLTPTPDTDWRFEGWAGDCDSKGYVFVDTEKHCEAIFVDANAEPFTLNVAITGNGSVTSEPTGIDCGATCSKEYATGLEVVLNAISDNGWKFEGWRGHCDEIGKVVLDGEFNFKQCRAVFVEEIKIEDSEDSTEETTIDASESESKPPALEVTKMGDGTITSQPSGIDCGNDCTEDYANDTEVTLTPIPNTDWRFEGWAGDCNSEGYVFVDTEKRCEAIFVDANAEPFTLNVAITGNGSITSEPTGIDCGTTCSKEYATGLEVALNATPDDDWKFEGWRGHCDETGHVTLDGDFGFKQCRAIFVESIKIEEKSDDSETDSDSSTDDDSETGSDSSTDDDSETDSSSSTNNDSETNSSSSTNNDSETGSDSSPNDDSEAGSDSSTDGGSETSSGTNTDDDSQTGSQTTDNAQEGGTNAIEKAGPNNGDGNNDGTLDSQQNNVLSLQNTNGEYVTVAEKNGCAINSNGNNLEFDCSQAEVDNYYYGVSDPSEVPQCQEPQVTCQVITIQGQSVVVASTTLNDGDVNNDRIAGDGKITQPLAPGQVLVQQDNGTSLPATSVIEDTIDINLQSVATIIKVGETVNLAIGGINGIFFIKEMPELALVAVDEETLINNGELTLIGLAVGNTQMIITDQVSSQEVTLYIKVLPAVTLEDQITASKDIGLKTRLTTLKVGQIVTLMIADGQGMLSIIGSPDDTLVSLSDWIAYGDGTADVTLKGLQAGSTQLIVKDSAIPPQQTALHIIVIGSSNDATSVNAPETPITDTTIAISLDDSPCEPLNALGIDAVGNLIESNACFVGKVSLQGILQSNDRQLTRRESQTLRVSARIQVAPEHVAQPAEILLVGAYSPSKAETMFYTRDEQTWFMWDEQISHLIIAQEHPVLPEIVDVFIFEGDLSFMPGEFTVYVGYRLLENGTIIYNGFEPIHFLVGNR